MSDTLFATEQDPAPAAEPVNQTAPAPTFTVPNEVAELIGEGKKYATVEDALRSIPHAQTHIATIEAENKDYQNRLMANDKLDKVLEKLTPQQPSAPAPEPTAPAPQGISRDELSALVQQEINQRETVNREEANRSTVESKLREVYGDDVGAVFTAKAAEVGMSPAQLTALAKVAPQAVITLVGENKSGSASPHPTSEGVNLGTVGDIGDPAPPKKDIMFGASTQDVISEWKACAPKLED